MAETEEVFLDGKYIYDFMELINNNEMFFHRSDLVLLYNLICTFKDRTTTAIGYINKHSDTPNTEEEFINFLVYAAMLYDGFNKMHENLLHNIPPYKGNKIFFKNAKHYKYLFFDKETCPTDDVFFEYLRAMAFAHPYEVSKKGRPFIKEGEKHYCPWVVINNLIRCDGFKDSVGIRIYTSADQDEIIDLTFSFNSLKGYIESIYNTFPKFIEWAKDVINGQNEEWKQTKVDRRQDNISILQEIHGILESRFASTYTIDTAIAYLTCKTTIESNNKNVQIFRDKIKQSIPEICDYIDNLDYEGMESALSFLYDYPNKMHSQAGYQLEKIFSYLDKRSEYIDPASNEYWGLQQAYLFSQEFAKKWVKIDVTYMQYDEIKLLVAVACYLEKQEQEK